jgi:hypothetical protein
MQRMVWWIREITHESVRKRRVELRECNGLRSGAVRLRIGGIRPRREG